MAADDFVTRGARGSTTIYWPRANDAHLVPVVISRYEYFLKYINKYCSYEPDF